MTRSARAGFPAAKKSLGQHFLRHRGVIDSIVRHLGPAPGDIMVEIGPGRGALTLAIAPLVHRLHVIELDRELADYWTRQTTALGNLTVHQADAAGFDYAALIDESPNTATKLRVVGNLPYNVSSPILFHLLAQADCIEDLHLMFQYEFARRLTAEPGGKSYGRLSVMAQERCGVELALRVSRDAFTPPPKVESAVVRLTPRRRPAVRAGLRPQFAAVVAAGFAQRRKTLRNALKRLLSEAQIVAAGVDPGARAEQLGVADYVALAERFAESQ